MSSSLSSKLLLYLSPDRAHIIDIALYLYGNVEMNSRHNVHTISNNLLDNGWEIQTRGHILSERHYELVQNNRNLINEWPIGIRLTPKNVITASEGREDFERLPRKRRAC